MAPSDFNRLASGSRLTQTALLRDPYCRSGGRVQREQYDRLIEGSRIIFPGYECNSPVAPSDFDRLV